MLWVILMEMKVSQVGCFQITGRWICYSIFFDISFIVFFTRLLSKSLWRNYPYQLKSISKCSILQKYRMSNFVMLKWQPFEYKVKKWKICPFLGQFFQKKPDIFADILNFHESNILEIFSIYTIYTFSNKKFTVTRYLYI